MERRWRLLSDRFECVAQFMCENDVPNQQCGTQWWRKKMTQTNTGGHTFHTHKVDLSTYLKIWGIGDRIYICG